jgi:hypothetical protein
MGAHYGRTPLLSGYTLSLCGRNGFLVIRLIGGVNNCDSRMCILGSADQPQTRPKLLQIGVHSVTRLHMRLAIRGCHYAGLHP